MPAKRKITINRKAKVVEKEPIIEENAVSTVIENEISDIEESSGTIIQAEKEIGLKKSDLGGKKEKSQVIGDVGGTKVTKSGGGIKFEAQVGAYPMFLVPAEIRNYLVKRGFTTNVYKKDKEWLEKHNVDMEIVEKLKKFLSERL